MAYNINLTEWEFSHAVAADKPVFPTAEAGDRYLKIIEAAYIPEDSKYLIRVQDLTNNARFPLTYWMKSIVKGTTELTTNDNSVRTLTSLGNALFFGQGVTVPFPDDIVGGVVIGRVKLVPDKDDPTKKYPRVYEFFPVPQDIALIADIDQYWVGRELEEAQ